MGYTTEELQVPINLRVVNLQAIVNDLQNQLSTLKVGSKGFKDVEGVLTRIRNEMDKLEVQTSKPFVNQRQFVTAERSIEKIEDGLSQAQLIMSRIKFSDLSLNTEQTNQIKQFNDEIANIKNNIKNVKEITKQNFFSTDIGKSWLGIDPNAINQTLQQITASITAAFAKQKSAVEEASNKFKEYENALSLKNKITNFTNQLNSVNTVKSSSAIFQGFYDQIFNAQGKFQNGGQTILAQWLAKEFELDEAQVSALVQGSASKVIASLKSGQLQELITSKLGSLQQTTSASYGAELKKQLDDARSLLATLTPIYNEVSGSQFGAASATKQFEAALKQTNAELEKYKQKQAEAAGTSSTWTNSLSRGRQSLQQLKGQLQETETRFLALERTQRNFQSIKMLITNFMGFTQVLNIVKTGVRNALSHIEELDSVMNKIAIVTDMSNSDLWKQIDSYSELSQKYGVSIKGAYEVSQIYYQQGLQTKDVLTLTNETLKLSKISGLDYAQTTDYMTTALRGFKMEMSEAATIVDVYSNLAAHTAVSQEELAVAMSKTASSLESVGSTFQEASAMIGTMVAVTRESATNIGSAMKSIAARYGEMKSNPSAIEDAEGEAIAYNKVDSALQSVGISLKDTDGQFRNFTDVIIELGEKWDQLESTQQRYIATQFAGNRQQSRFLALISNVDLLKSNLQYAKESEDVGDIQALKALDSIPTKIEQVKVAYQEMYTTIGVENVWKGALDSLKNFMNTLNGLPKLFNTVPLGAIAMIADVIKVVKDLGFMALHGVSKIWTQIVPNNFGAEQGEKIGAEMAKGLLAGLAAARQALEQGGKKATESAAKGAGDALKDKNTKAGKEQVPEQSKTVQTTQAVSEETISKTQAVESATQAISNNLSNAAGASSEMASNFKDAASAISSVSGANDASLNEILSKSKSTFTPNFMTAVNLKKINFAEDPNASAQFTQLFVDLAKNSADAATFSAAGEEAIAAYAKGILANAGVAEDAAKDAAEKAAAGFKLNQWLDQNITDLGPNSSSEGIIEQISKLPQDILSQVEGPLKTLGTDIPISIAQGMIASQGVVGDAATSLASSIINALRNALNMHSPSPTIIAMFENGVGEAIALGLEASQGVVESAAAKLGLSVSEQLKEAFENSDKINLSDHFEAGSARELAQAVAQSTIEAQEKELNKLDKQIKWGYGDREMRAQRVTTKNSLAANLDILARMQNIQYEKRSVDSLYIAHNFKEKYLSGMTGWGGVFPQPSAAARATNDKVYSGYGGATAFLPRVYADPASGLAAQYRGDAATPIIMSKPGVQLTLEQAHAQLNRHNAVNYDLETNMLDMIRDASKLYSIGQILQQARTITAMPFGASPYGDGGAFRISESMNDERMDAWESNLDNLLAQYIQKSQFKMADYKLTDIQEGAEYNGREAYTAAMYKTVNDMAKAESNGIDLNLQEILSQNLYNAFKDMAKIDVSSAFQDAGASNLINESLKYIQYAIENPRHDYAEIKALGDVSFKDLTGLLASYNNLSKEDLSGAFSAGLDPRRTFLYDANAMSGPLSRESIANYMVQNVPGIAFDEKGPLVQGEIESILNLDELRNTLTAENLNLPPVKIDAMIDAAGSIMDSDIGQVLSNTLKAALSNIDFSSEDAASQVTQIIQTISSQMISSVPQLQAAGTVTAQQIIAGLAIGLSSNLAAATGQAQGAGQAVIAALNAGAGVASPSIFAMQSGRFIMLGLANGMSEGARTALAEAQEAAKSVITVFDLAIDQATPETLEKIKEKFKMAIDTLKFSDEQKQQLIDQVDNWTLEDIKNTKPFMAGAHGEVTEQGINAILDPFGTFKTQRKIDTTPKEAYLAQTRSQHENWLEQQLGIDKERLALLSNSDLYKAYSNAGKYISEYKQKNHVGVEDAHKDLVGQLSNNPENLQKLVSGELLKTLYIDTSQAKEQAEEAKASIEAGSPVKVQEQIDTSAAKEEAQATKTEIESNPVKIKTEITPDKEGEHTLQEKMAALEKLREAQAAAKGTAKGSAEYQARTEALNNARSITGMNLSWNSNVDKAMDSVAGGAISARIQELLSFYQGDKAAMAAQMGNSTDEQLRQVASMGAANSDEAEINYQALKQLQRELLLSVKVDEGQAQQAGEAAVEKAQAAADSKPVKPKVEPPSAESGQLAFDLDNPSLDNLKVVPIQGEVEGVTESANEAITNAEGQIDTLDIAVSSQQAVQDFQNSYTYDEESNQYILKDITVNVSLSTEEYEAKLAELQAKAEETLTAVNANTTATVQEPQAPASEPLDPAVLDNVSILIDRLVEVGVVSEEAGAKLKASLANASPEELAAKFKELEGSVHALGSAGEETGSKLSKINFNTIGSAVRILSNITGMGNTAKGVMTGLGGAISAVGSIFQYVNGAISSFPWMAVAMGVMGVINGFSQAIEDSEERMERLKKEAEESSNKAKQLKSDSKELSTNKKKLDELDKKRYESTEAAEEYQSAVDNITDKFPELIAGFDKAGDAILDAAQMEQVLAEARKKTADATYEAAYDEWESAKEQAKQSANKVGESVQDFYFNLLAVDDIETMAWRIGRYQFAQNYLINNEEGINNIDEASKELQNRAIYRNSDLSDYDFFSGLFKSAEYYKNHMDQISNIKPNEDWSKFIATIKEITSLDFLEYSSEQQAKIIDQFVQLMEEFTNAGIISSDLYKDFIKSEDYKNIKNSIDLAKKLEASSKVAVGRYVEGKDYSFADNKAVTALLVENLDKQLNKESPSIENLDEINAGQHYGERLEAWYKDLSDEQKKLFDEMYFSKRFTAKDIIDKFKNTNNADIIEELLEEDASTYVERREDLIKNLHKQVDNYAKVKKTPQPTIKRSNVSILGGIKMPTIKQEDKEFFESSFLQEYEKLVTDTEQQFSINEQTILNQIISNYSSLLQQGMPEMAELYGTVLLGFYNQIQDSNLTRELKTKLLEQLLTNGLNREGLEQTIKYVTNNADYKDVIKTDDLQGLVNSYTTNISLSISSSLDSLQKAWKDKSKDIKKLASGADLSEIDEFLSNAKSIGMDNISISDLIIDGEKFLLSTEDYQTYIEKTVDNLKTDTNQLTANLNEAMKVLSEEQFSSSILDENTVKALRAVLGQTVFDEQVKATTIKEFAFFNDTDRQNLIQKLMSENESIEDYSNVSSTKLAELAKSQGIDTTAYGEFYDVTQYSLISKDIAALRALIDESKLERTKEIEDYLNWLENVKNQFMKSSEWKQGDFSSLDNIFKNFDGFKDLTGEGLSQAVTERLKKLVSGEEMMKPEELEQPDIVNAVKQIRTAYNTYINDLISKDIKTLYAEDYVQTGRGKDEIAREMAQAQGKTAKGFAQWIAGLAEAAGQTISEQNDAFVKAFDKIHSQDTLDGVKEVQFLDDQYFSATTSQLKTFADTYNLSINKMVTSQIARYNEAMGQWVVDYTRLGEMGLDLDSIDGFKETVADSVNSFFDKLVSTIKNALSGSLTNMDAKNLQQYANQIGFIGDLNFTETPKGLQIAEQSALSLYAALKKVDSLKASLVFDELNNSLKENNDNFATVSTIMGHIRKISQDIYATDGKTSKARLEQYEAELEVAKEILAVRSTSEDESFNFMSNKIPAAQNNPLNYAKNLTQAFQTFRDAFDTSKVKKDGKAGFMDYEDWYNIVTEFNHMAAVTGTEIKLGANTLDGSLEAAADAIQDGASALTTVDTGELKVNLTSIGVGIESGADALSAGVTAGVQGVAKAQVEALNGLIAMLELIVSMEQLGDIDVDENGIDLSDLFKVTYDSKGNRTYTEFSEDYKKWVDDIKDKIDKDSKNYNEDLANAVNGIKINGTAFSKILDWNPSDFTDPANKSVAEAYAAMLNAFNKAALSGNYDLDNIQKSVLEVLAESGFDDTVTLDIGDITYVISSGVMTTLDWNSANIKSIVNEISQKYNLDKNQARDKLTSWIEAYGKNEESLEETEILYVLRTKKKVTVENDQIVSVKVGEKTYNTKNSDQLTRNAAVNAAILEDFGYDVTNWEITDPTTGKVEINTTIGDKVIRVKSEKGLVRLLSEDGKREYKNEDAFFEGEWRQWLKEQQHGMHQDRQYNKIEEWKWGEFNVATQVKPKFSYKINNEDVRKADPSTDTKLQTKLTDLMASGRKAMQALITEQSKNGDGTYTIDLGDGYQFTFTGGTNPLAALEKAIGEQLGIDIGLSNAITAAITNAFANESVSQAISTAISNGLASAVGGAEGKIEEVPLPSITLKPTEVNVDITGVTPTVTPSPVEVSDLTATSSGEVEVTAAVTEYYNDGDPDFLVSQLSALVTEYANDGDPDSVVNALSAIVNQYTNGGDPDSVVQALYAIVTEYGNGGDPDSVVNALSAMVTAYANGGDPDSVVNALSAIITLYSNGGNPNTVVQALSALVTTYTNGGDPNSVVSALQAFITEYKDGPGVEKPTLEALTQFIDKINTDGANAALEAWRKEQEGRKLSITPEVKSSSNQYGDIRKVLYGTNTRTDRSGMITDLDLSDDVLNTFGITRTLVTGVYSDANNNIKGYLNSLSQVVSKGQALGKVDLKNIQTLSELNWDDASITKLLDDLNQDNNFNLANLEGMTEQLQALAELNTSGLDSIASSLERVASAVMNLLGVPWTTISSGINSLIASPETTTTTTTTSKTSPTVDNTAATSEANAAAANNAAVANQAAAEASNEAAAASENVASSAESAAGAQDGLASSTAKAGEQAGSAAGGFANAGSASSIAGNKASAAASAIQTLADAISSIPEHTVHDITLNLSASVSESSGKGNVSLTSMSPTNISALSFAKGKARAGGQSTLMGELGPELVVSNGSYFLVGQSGAEFVDLAPDAIVFNHKQTASLFSNGKAGRGKPITNENNAISWAKGNINGGPAMASAAAALAALKQLRAQWQALAGLTAQDLAGTGGGGGGGGGGDPKAFIKDLEKWYDWLQQIAQLEKEITLEEAKRAKYQSDMVARGKEYFTSQKESLELLQEQITVQKSLSESQEAYFEKRKAELNQQSAFSALYGFSDSGQLYYKDVYKNNKSALEWLSDLAGRNATTGEANYTAEEQYNKLVDAGFGFAMKYDSSGNEIKQEGTDWYNTAVQAFWDKIEADKQEMQTLHDSVEDAKKKVYELENQQNEILKEIEENQITVEQKVLKAVEESRQREIDELQKQRTAIEKSAKDMIDGLSDQLNKEKELYNQQNQADELSKLQRQLSILQRSGGSQAQIADLQKQIADKQQNLYFDTQQKQIDALQEASDNELERLDHQIEIMKETLDYQKEYGLLWNAVYEQLQKSPADISAFIKENTKEYWGQSPTELVKTIREDLFEIERFKQFQATVEGGMDVLTTLYGDEVAEKKAEKKKKEEEEEAARKAEEDKKKQQQQKSSGGGSGGSKVPTKKTPTTPANNDKKWVYDDKTQGRMVQVDASGNPTGAIKYDDAGLPTYGSTRYYEALNAKRQQSIKDIDKEIDTLQQQLSYLKTQSGYHGEEYQQKQIDALEQKKANYEAQIKQTEVEIDLRKNGVNQNNSQNKKINSASLQMFATGGLDEYTGIAMLHGTKTKPEAVLNTEQTRILRNNILSNRPDSLISLLRSYNEAYQGLSASTYDSISNNSNATIIEHAEVNLNIEKLANDYDSKRAANTVMTEMLRIASKTSANNSVRR